MFTKKYLKGKRYFCVVIPKVSNIFNDLFVLALIQGFIWYARTIKNELNYYMNNFFQLTK